MKKLLLLICLLSGLLSTAQNNLVYPQDGLNRFQSIEAPQADPYRGAQIKRWYNYGETNDLAYNASLLYISDYIFPDSALFDYSNGVGRSFYYKIASVIDPKAAIFNTYVDPDFNKFLNYYVDSVKVPFRYHRNSAKNVVDTLIIEVGSDSSVAMLYRSSPDVFTDYKVNTVSFDYLKFNAGASSIGAMELPKKTTLIVTLDSNWITNTNQKDLLAASFPLHLPRFNRGENIFVALTFKPGFSYTLNDTISKTGNTFQTIMWEEQGANTFPVYTPGELNCSYFANYYNLDPQNGLMYEGFYPYYVTPAWPKALPEHFGFSANIRYDEAWIGITTNDGIISANCFPNPASNKALVAYTVEKSENVKIKLFDISGQLIYEKEEGIKPQGQYFSEIDISALSAGAYLYSVGTSKMNKLIIE